MSLTGYENQDPVRVGSSIGDMCAGLFTAIGIQAALIKRQNTGKGEKGGHVISQEHFEES